MQKKQHWQQKIVKKLQFNMKKILDNKTAKGITGFVMIMLMMISVFMFALSNNTSITANVVKFEDTDTAKNNAVIQTKEINSLSQLNEGWYEIRNGFVFYLEDFNTPVPLYIRLKNSNQNGMAVVDSDGTVSFEESSDKLVEKIITDKDIRKSSSSNQITGNAVGMSAVTGMQTATPPTFTGTASSIGRGWISLVQSSTTDEQGNYRAFLNDGTAVFIPKDGSSFYFGNRKSDGTYNWQQNTGNGPLQTIAQPPGYSPVPAAEQRSGAQGGGTAAQGAEGTQKTQNGLPIPPEASRSTGNLPTPTETHTSQEIISGAFKLTPKTPFKASDNAVYYQECSTCPIQVTKNNGGNWKNVERTFYFDAVDVNKRSGHISQPAFTQDEAKKLLEVQGFTNVHTGNPSTPTQLPPSSRPTGTYVLSPDKKYITNPSLEPVFVTPGMDPQQYLDDYNNKAKVLDAYHSWLAKSGVKDSPANQALFSKYPSEGITTPDADKAFNLVTPPKTGTQNSEPKETKLPNGNPGWILPNGDVTDDKFLGEHPNAKKEPKITTGNDQPVYSLKGQYYGSDGKPVASINQKITITGNEYDAVYTLTDGKNPAISSVNGYSMTPSTLKYINDNAKGKGDSFTISSEGFTITKATTTVHGQEISTVITGSQSRIYDLTTFTKKNKDGAITGLVITEQGHDKDGKGITYNQRTEYSRGSDGTINKDSSDYITILTDATGKPTRVDAKVNGVSSSAATGTGGQNGGGGRALEILNKEISQYTWRQRFATAERWLTEFRGLGYYATLFMSDDSLLHWREETDKVFSNLYLGTEYWSSGICGKYINTGSSEGIAFADTPQGVAQVATHIEATRTQPIQSDTGTEYVYKITFSVRNGDYEEDLRAPEKMNIKVIIKGQTESKLFKNDVEVKRGTTFGRAGTKAIVKQSKKLYDKVCIEFDQIPEKWHIENKQLCNKVIEENGEPLSLERLRQQEEQQASGEPVLSDDW
ncbi:MAG: hypothetical protein AABX00_05980 [Nanoarchaeota archaeon]